MDEPITTPEQNSPQPTGFQFGAEMILEQAGFSFQPISGFELEVDGSVYMYSDDGNLEISMVGGKLENETSIADLNDELAAEFMENFDEFKLIEAGKDHIQGVTGLLNEIRFVNAEEEGLGRALICSPYINQFFFLLVISSAEHWEQIGHQVFTALKEHIHFHSQFKPPAVIVEVDDHPDLTIETYGSITPEDELIITIEKGDVSLLLAARTANTRDEITVTHIWDPGSQSLYHYDPASGDFSSAISAHPLISTQGEVCIFLPCASHPALQIGDYRVTFAVRSGQPLQEVQVIIRQGRALDLQKVDLNLWLALEDERFNDPNYLAQIEAGLREALKQELAPMNLAPGKIETFHPAPDELAAFASINLDSELADCSYMISQSIENGRALNIGFVDHLTRGNPPVDAEVSAVSSGSPGMILSPVSPHACVLINFSAYAEDFSALAKAIVDQLVNFSGVQAQSNQPEQPLTLNQDLAWLLRRHPIFYDAG